LLFSSTLAADIPPGIIQPSPRRTAMRLPRPTRLRARAGLAPRRLPLSQPPLSFRERGLNHSTSNLTPELTGRAHNAD
ncbi:MAG TPA: hypothetical protein VEF04_20820, partial [Blastocatellia bacterium]|nr:hypothetical protein [Blastocatellia bacterium]